MCLAGHRAVLRIQVARYPRICPPLQVSKTDFLLCGRIRIACLWYIFMSCGASMYACLHTYLCKHIFLIEYIHVNVGTTRARNSAYGDLHVRLVRASRVDPTTKRFQSEYAQCADCVPSLQSHSFFFAFFKFMPAHVSNCVILQRYLSVYLNYMHS